MVREEQREEERKKKVERDGAMTWTSHWLGANEKPETGQLGRSRRQGLAHGSCGYPDRA